jgi:pyruvate,orthophosphate dikinase
MAGPRYVFNLAEGSKDMRGLLSGKGANVAEMTKVLGPDRVPAGFTLPTEACVEYMRAGRNAPHGWPSRSPMQCAGSRNTAASA